MVHDPMVLFLDEPLTGTDPVARRELIDVIIDWGRQGRTVLVSSHIFHEVQAVTRSIVLLNRGPAGGAGGRAADPRPDRQASPPDRAPLAARPRPGRQARRAATTWSASS